MFSRGLLQLGLGAAVLAVAACRAPGADHNAIRDAAAAHGGEVTVAGCLQRPDDGDRMVLVNTILARERAGFPLREGMQPPEIMIGTTGTTGTIPATVRGPRYTLDVPLDAAVINEHVGRQVQVTGRLVETQEGRTSEDAGSSAGEGTRPDNRARGHIQAEEVRLIAAACM